MNSLKGITCLGFALYSFALQFATGTGVTSVMKKKIYIVIDAAAHTNNYVLWLMKWYIIMLGICLFTKLLQQFLEIRLPLLSHPLFSTLPVLSKPSRKHTWVIGKQVLFEKFRIAELSVDVIYKMCRPKLLVGLSWYFHQAAAVAVRVSIHDCKQS